MPTQRLKKAVKRIMPADRLRALQSKRQRLEVKASSLLNDPLQFERAAPDRECPICGFRGRFWSFGSPPRAEALCPSCMSLERHRLLRLLFLHRATLGQARRVLHFAPEPFLRDWVRRARHYVTADASGHRVACACAMEAIPFRDALFDLIIANHVLEHVGDERRALAELARVVAPPGVVLLSVPQVHGWSATYEDSGIVEPHARRKHFGQEDHLRLYGHDFAERLAAAGFAVEAFQAGPRAEVRYGLQRGETLFVARPGRRAQAADRV